MTDNEKLFDGVAQQYDDLLHQSLDKYGKDIGYYSEYKVKLVANGLRNAQPRTILEFGCGTGRNINYLRQYFPNATVVGCDISSASLKQARAENPQTEFTTVDDALASGKRFDLIFVAGVFHHIDPADRTGALGQLLRLLTPGGNIYIFEHNPFNPLTRRAVSSCPFDEGVQLIKPAELVQRATDAKLAVRERQFCLFFPSALKAFSPLERAMGVIPMGGQYFVRLTNA